MTAAFKHRTLVMGSAIAGYAVVFAAFVIFEVPGLGIAHFFYLPVAALALTGGVRRGAVAGAVAAMLFSIGVLINPNISPTELVTLTTPIRVVTFAFMGALIGWFAANDRARGPAPDPGRARLPHNTRAFEAAIARRLDSGTPFALLLGDMDRLKQINDSQGHAEGNDALRRLALPRGGRAPYARKLVRMQQPAATVVPLGS